MDEFHDEARFKELNEREVAAWLEVKHVLHIFHKFQFIGVRTECI